MILLDELAASTGAEVLISGGRTSCEGFAHDSRALLPGECFVAVRGLHRDGHDFLVDALERGAGALLVERARLQAQPQLAARARESGAALLAVADTREALRRYAAHVLARWGPTVVAVTGGVGKTTTKEAIADVLKAVTPTFRSWRNYNDLLGLPLSLGRLEPAQRYVVLEMGADHPGEIRELCAMARPRVGVVTNVSPTHLQYFGSLAALRDELAELPAALPPDGLAVLNAADEATPALRRATAAHTLLFGPRAIGTLDNTDVPVRFAVAPLGSRDPLALTLQPLDAAGEPAGGPIVFPHLHSDTWADAVLAALTVGEALGVSRAAALEALRDLRPPPGRMRWLEGADGLLVLDDSHNATPTSAAAGLVSLAAIGKARGARRIAVLGDMLHLGAASEAAHRHLGRAAVASADFLVTRGERAEAVAGEALRAGLPTERVAITHTAADAAQAVRHFAAGPNPLAPFPLREAGIGGGQESAVVYIKGSEELRMEQVTALLLKHPEQAEALLDRQTQAWQRVVVMQPDRPTWLEIDLDAIGGNTRLVKGRVGHDVDVLVSLKADGYGHGALRVARTVLRNGASWLGVATISEAQPLRAAGIDAPILIFGYIAPWQARDAVAFDLRATVYALDAAQTLARAASDLGREIRVHVKVDTGMARLGLRGEDVAGIVAFVERLHELPGLVVEGLFTHFATADSADQTYARRQLDRFETVLAALDARGLRPPIVHAANSAALLALPESWYDMVRPGIAIYGLSPSDEVPAPPGFRPALAFKTQVAQVKDIPPGEGVGYGATHITSAPTHVAVLPVGYADGFRRAPATWGEVLVRGRRAPLVGRVCMDQCMIDVTHIAGVRQGDEVVLIGRQGEDELTAEAVAARLGTISYEVVAALLARVPRVSRA
jgi:alanine racemase